ncbi:MAG: alpha/beta fold hydrolase [Gemmatimonadota bacterium]
MADRPRIRLFCFPYSGAGASIFGGWTRALPEFVEVRAVELPGRGRRIREATVPRLPALVDDVAALLETELDAPYALFGHSMGALLAFELARSLRRTGANGPVHFFASGHAAPQTPRTDDPLHVLPEDEFVERVRSLEGTADELLEHEEFRRILIPVLRADFAVCETYVHEPGEPLDCGITVFGGVGDPYVDRDTLLGWREHTRGPFALRMLPGGHFFLNTARQALLEAVARDLIGGARRT